MQCSFTSTTGIPCQEQALGGGLCYWHEDSDIKDDADLCERLEQRARTGITMAYFKLRHANLHGINLVNHGNREGYRLVHSDLYRADLRDAHLFGLDLSFSSLMKADLSGANLHSVNLEHTNLLGVKLDEAKLEGVQWGEMVRQEWQGLNAEDPAMQRQYFSEAEEIYRAIGRVMRNQGMVSEIGWFFYREMVVRRLQMPAWSAKRAFSKFIDLYCGYGEKPLRLVAFSTVIILVLSLLYATLGLHHDGQPLSFSADGTVMHNVEVFFSALYFSVVTFTTLGYGDFSPIGISRFIASLEAFTGSFTIAMFVVVFVRQMTR